MKLLTVIPYCQKDLAITTKLLEWIHELATAYPFTYSPLLLAADSAVPRSDIDTVAALARKSWPWVKTMIVGTPTDGWAPTQMFRIIAEQIHSRYRLPFFWMEPDCIPLTSSWLQKLEEAYDDCPKRYLGALITQNDQPNLPAVHMTGCGIYPNDAINDFMKIKDLNNQAWDIAGANFIVPKVEDTTLIHHYWGMKDLPPVFVDQRTPDAPKNHLTLDFIRRGAVLFHRSKDGKLIDLLRGMRKAQREIKLDAQRESAFRQLDEKIEQEKAIVAGIDLAEPGSEKTVVPKAKAKSVKPAKPQTPAPTPVPTP